MEEGGCFCNRLIKQMVGSGWWCRAWLVQMDDRKRRGAVQSQRRVVIVRQPSFTLSGPWGSQHSGLGLEITLEPQSSGGWQFMLLEGVQETQREA